MVSGLSEIRGDAPKIEWRDATSADHEFLRHLMRVTVKDYLLKNSPQTDEECESHIGLLCALPWQVVSLNGKDVGGIAFERVVRSGRLSAFHVLPEHQNRGIGSEILKTLVEWAMARRISIYLAVMVVNKGAKRLYERFGFVEVGLMEDGNNFRMELHPPPSPPLDFSFLTRWLRRRKE